MSGLIPESFIADLLARIDIVDVVSERVALKKAGRDWAACCPFHDERTPSFTVSPSKQFYHCFGCGASGSAVRFLMEYDRLEFPDAIEELAARLNLEVPRNAGREAVARPAHDDLYTLLDEAARFYARQLQGHSAAQAYLAARGLSADIIARFNIGHAGAQWDGLRNALGGTPRLVERLEVAGLVSRNTRDNTYDRFRDRVMFPIVDRRGRVIAFGGRLMSDDADAPKYLNSPETPLFHKGRELFGFWQARQANRKLERLIVVEGYMDVLALHQHGLTQAVATLGTATTGDHVQLLFRNAADVYFCFDGDRAGRQAAWRAVESMLPHMRDGRQAWFVLLPEGEDPDSIVQREGAAGFEQRLAAATPLSELFYAHVGSDANLDTLDGRARLVERARPLLAQLPAGAFRDLMHERLAELSGIRPQETPSTPPARRVPARTSGRPARPSLVRTAIALLLEQPSVAAAVEPPWLFAALRQPGVALLLEMLDKVRAQPGIHTAALIEQFAHRPEHGALYKLAQQTFPGDAEGLLDEFRGALQRLAEQTHEQRRGDLLARLDALDDAEKTELRSLLASKPTRH